MLGAPVAFEHIVAHLRDDAYVRSLAELLDRLDVDAGRSVAHDDEVGLVGA